MNPRNLQNNKDLVAYLHLLRKRLVELGRNSLADDVDRAGRFVIGSASEFLHETQLVLERVVSDGQTPLTIEERKDAEAVIAQITAAFRKIGGA
jgi:hypothetical protein